MQKVYISSTYKDFKEYRTTLISLFHKQLKGKFELCEIMEHMFDDGSSSTYVEECVAAVKECDIYFIILGNSVGSYPPNESRTYTEIEYQTAMEEDKFIYRLQLENIDEKTIDDPVKHKALRDSFEGKHVTYFNDEAELEGIFLKSLLNHFKEINTENPYRGMNPFQIEDGSYFFGRELEIEKFIKLILTTENERVFSVVGDSGIGKSSFVRAGVMHRMLAEEVMGYSEHIPLIFRPGEQPLTNLKYQLRRHAGIHDQELSAKNFEGAKLLLFIDQLEELYTQGHTEESAKEKEAFIRLMNELASHPNLNILLFLTYRSDFAETLSQHAFVGVHAQEFYPKSFDFKKNNAQWEQSITEIITAPAEKHGVSLESELVSSLIQELEDLDGCLPILQMTLYQLWDPKVIKDHQIKYSELLKLSQGKGIIGLLQNHANSVASKISKKGKDKVRENILKSMLLNLVEVSDEHGDLKRTLSKKKLFEKLDHYPTMDVEQVFEELVSQKSRLLLVTGRESNCDSLEGTETGSCVTLVHEELISKWPKLQQWVEERREALKLQKRLIRDVRDYEEKKGSLYRGKRLRNAVLWQQKNKDFYDHSIKRFLRKSKVSQLFIFSIPFLLGILMTLFYFLAFKPYIQKEQFLNNVVNARPEMLKNFLKVKASLQEPQTLSLASGTLEELNSQYSLKYNIPLKQNLRYFANVEGLELMNNPRIEHFNQVKAEMETQSEFTTLKTNLKTLSLVHLNKLSSLDGIRELDNLSKLELKRNLRLNFLDSIDLPRGLEFLNIEDNDGLSTMPSLANMEELKGLRFVGNDAYQNFDVSLPAALDSMVISGNSLLESVQGLERSPNLTKLTIDYNDNLKTIQGLNGLKKMSFLAITENPVIKKLEDIDSLSSLLTLKIGLAELAYLPALPSSIETLYLNGNRSLKNAYLYRLKNLINAEIDKNTVLESVTLPQSVQSAQIINNSSLVDIKIPYGGRGLKRLILSNNRNLENLPDLGNRWRINYLRLDSMPKFKALGPLARFGTNYLDSLEISQLGDEWFLKGNSFDNIASLQKLKYLKVNGPYFKYDFNLVTEEGRKFKSLEELIIHGHNDNLPGNWTGPSFSGIPTLKSLTLKDNGKWIDLGSIQLENLEQLTISNNARIREVPKLELLSKLKELTLANNERLRAIPSLLENKELHFLELRNNMNIKDYRQISKLTSLDTLILAGNDLHLRDVNFLDGMPSLKKLALIENKSLEDISGLMNLSELTHLQISDNPKLSTLPQFGNLEGLKILELTNNSNLYNTIHLSDTLVQRLDTLIIFGNNQLQFDKIEVEKLKWEDSKISFLELDTRTFKELFVKPDKIDDLGKIVKSGSLLKLVIHLKPNEDIRELDLIEIQKQNKDLEIVLFEE